MLAPPSGVTRGVGPALRSVAMVTAFLLGCCPPPPVAPAFPPDIFNQHYESLHHGDVNLGAIVSVHSNHLGRCSENLTMGSSATEFLEAILFAVRQVNADNVIPDVTLGVYVLDDCFSASLSLMRAIQFMPVAKHDDAPPALHPGNPNTSGYPSSSSGIKTPSSSGNSSFSGNPSSSGDPSSSRKPRPSRGLRPPGDPSFSENPSSSVNPRPSGKPRPSLEPPVGLTGQDHSTRYLHAGARDTSLPKPFQVKHRGGSHSPSDKSPDKLVPSSSSGRMSSNPAKDSRHSDVSARRESGDVSYKDVTTVFDVTPNREAGVSASSDVMRGRRNLTKEKEEEEGEGRPQFFEVAGVIGAFTSQHTIEVAKVLQLFKLPLISPSATGDVLSDKQRFPYFLRTLPPDRDQVKALGQLLRHFNWTYVSVVYSQDPYGHGSHARLAETLEQQDICVAQTLTLSNAMTSSDYDVIVTSLLAREAEARVVLLYADVKHVGPLFAAVEREGAGGNLVWVGSDSLFTVLQHSPHLCRLNPGSLAVKARAVTPPAFQQHMMRRIAQRRSQPCQHQPHSPDSHTSPDSPDSQDSPPGQPAKPYSLEDWHVPNNWLNLQDSASPMNPEQSFHNSRDLDLDNNPLKFSLAGFVIDAVYAYAHAIGALLARHCPGAAGGEAASCLRRHALHPFLQRVSFRGTSGGRFEFDDNGDVVGAIDVRQCQLGRRGEEEGEAGGGGGRGRERGEEERTKEGVEDGEEGEKREEERKNKKKEGVESGEKKKGGEEERKKKKKEEEEEDEEEGKDGREERKRKRGKEKKDVKEDDDDDDDDDDAKKEAGQKNEKEEEEDDDDDEYDDKENNDKDHEQKDEEVAVHKLIGSWEHRGAILEVQDARFAGWPRGGVPRSVCGEPCLKGEIYAFSKQACCWSCVACKDNEEVTANASACVPCPLFQWPDPQSRQRCRDIRVPASPIHRAVSLALQVLAVLGLMLTLVTAFTFGLYRATRVIRSSSRELSAVMLGGVTASYLLVFPLLATPSASTCYLTHVGFGLTFTLVYAPLLVKTHRIFRIFRAGRQSAALPACTSSASQLGITTLLISVQVLIVTVSTAVDPPSAHLHQPVRTERRVERLCRLPVSGLGSCLAYHVLLVALCTVLAFKARRLPDNYNESRYIAFCVDTTLLVWITFVPAYFSASVGAHKVVVLALIHLINSYVQLCCLFLPRLHALYRQTKKPKGDVVGNNALGSYGLISIKGASTPAGLSGAGGDGRGGGGGSGGCICSLSSSAPGASRKHTGLVDSDDRFLHSNNNSGAGGGGGGRVHRLDSNVSVSDVIMSVSDVMGSNTSSNNDGSSNVVVWESKDKPDLDIAAV